MCEGDGSRRLSFKLAYMADTEKCPSRDVEVREGLLEPNLMVLHVSKSVWSVRTFCVGAHSIAV